MHQEVTLNSLLPGWHLWPLCSRPLLSSSFVDLKGLALILMPLNPCHGTYLDEDVSFSQTYEM